VEVDHAVALGIHCQSTLTQLTALVDHAIDGLAALPVVTAFLPFLGHSPVFHRHLLSRERLPLPHAENAMAYRSGQNLSSKPGQSRLRQNLTTPPSGSRLLNLTHPQRHSDSFPSL